MHTMQVQFPSKWALSTSGLTETFSPAELKYAIWPVYFQGPPRSLTLFEVFFRPRPQR